MPYMHILPRCCAIISMYSSCRSRAFWVPTGSGGSSARRLGGSSRSGKRLSVTALTSGAVWFASPPSPPSSRRPKRPFFFFFLLPSAGPFCSPSPSFFCASSFSFSSVSFALPFCSFRICLKSATVMGASTWCGCPKLSSRRHHCDRRIASSGKNSCVASPSNPHSALGSSRLMISSSSLSPNRTLCRSAESWRNLANARSSIRTVRAEVCLTLVSTPVSDLASPGCFRESRLSGRVRKLQKVSTARACCPVEQKTSVSC
mmetsp:Transcript_16615/g.36152  ORF Transcript_16615/g.36152 Transcript_16615/m.36152 type:complete len:260 (+) Transcript_16615:193-972(+)